MATLWGVVQGVGFRPLVARLARELSLAGRVWNAPGRLELELEGAEPALLAFGRRLREELPRAARVERIEWRQQTPKGEREFRIAASSVGPQALGIPPDLAVCDQCLAEVHAPDGRRHAYPFTNCTRCGPRFTISAGAPYDRERTSMASFAMCQACRREYSDLADRRYHAQPIACPDCGPSLRLLDSRGAAIAQGPAALERAATALRRGRIVAVKGLGGYQLLVRADSNSAVQRLRSRKRRASKPMAVLVSDLSQARELALISEAHAQALTHPAAPIVLVRARAPDPGSVRAQVARAVAPAQRRLGLMLPATPLHALIARRTCVPLVCTSGNLHDEPICIDDSEALCRLAAVADAFLAHDRAILRRADDSVVQVVCGRTRALRTARGLAPDVIPLPRSKRTLLALGGHQKVAPVLGCDGGAVLWPHVGDLDTPAARDALGLALADLEQLAGVRAAEIAVDLHPDFATRVWAEQSGRPLLPVQHHHAHIAAVLAEHGEAGALGFAWDGVGLGRDGAAWGGEALAVDTQGARRLAHLRPFPLVGGDAASRDGRRALAGLCHAANLPVPREEPALKRLKMLAGSTRFCPPTTSVGRLFDAVAALTGVATHSSFEGEAALALENVAEPGAAPYPFELRGGSIDWKPMLQAMLPERHDAVRVASRFHATLAALVAELAHVHAAEVVALGGGCFQNELLLTQANEALETRGIRTLLAERVPPSDGGLALGQAWVIAARR